MVEKNTKRKQKKIYILDTNVLLHDPNAIFAFEHTMIGIPTTVLEELDTFKKEGTDKGRNCREVTRQLDALRQKGSLREGVALENGSILKILFLSKKLPEIAFNLPVKDNEILLTALCTKAEGYEVVFISKDINARIKADAIGLETDDYIKEYVSEEDFYQGWIRIQAPSVQLKQDIPNELITLAQEYKLTQNEFVLVESQHNPFNYRVFRFLGGNRFKAVHDPEMKWPLKARNAQQLMALDLLFDDSIKLLCLLGPAGTGKTFLALLAALYKTLVEDTYEKIMVTRPVVPLGRDLGYLPGTMEEKLHSWMLPVFDNMEFITHSINMARQFQETGSQDSMFDRRHRNKRRHDKKERKDRNGLYSVQDLVHAGKLSMEAITYMRGRSIPYQFIIIDEVQNLTAHEVKTLVTRVGEGSKIILAGDPYQIDSPFLDFSSNGLVIANERFKGQALFGSVFLDISERSELSQLAGKLL